MLTRILSFSLQELVLNFSDFRTRGLVLIEIILFQRRGHDNIFGLTCGFDNIFSETWPRFFSDMWQCAKRKIRMVGQALIGAVQSITDVNCTNLILHWPLTRN